MTFLIEKIRLENLDEVLYLFKNTIENSCSKDYNQTQISAWTLSIENRERWINKINTQYFIVAKLNDKIVGFGSLKDSYLDMLFVHHNYLRKGIASLIFEDLKSQSTKKGFTKLTTFASKTALEFFHSKGFSVISENKVMINEVEITNFEMSQ